MSLFVDLFYRWSETSLNAEVFLRAYKSTLNPIWPDGPFLTLNAIKQTKMNLSPWEMYPLPSGEWSQTLKFEYSCKLLCQCSFSLYMIMNNENKPKKKRKETKRQKSYFQTLSCIFNFIDWCYNKNVKEKCPLICSYLCYFHLIWYCNKEVDLFGLSKLLSLHLLS